MAGKDGSQKSVVKKRQIGGHAAAGIVQNLVYGRWGSYNLIVYRDVWGSGRVDYDVYTYLGCCQ